ncbi:hypothetical protein TI39_contig4154g00015 [Zymoseptoria brevis]|uniref:Uncharacterized protein n=1 Tax=Zymoseptoria brevis TaxID=1047168 RepID=A0A0F4GFA4_9PEZI|nr:hypothetical protein TI39_contig4154g00015 [Zymoseptoria brevis]
MSDEKPFIGGIPFPGADFAPVREQHDERRPISAPDPPTGSSTTARPGKLRAIRRRDERLHRTPYRNWQDIILETTPVKESTPFISNAEWKRAIRQPSPVDEKPYLPISSDSEDYKPDVDLQPRGRKRKSTATNARSRVTGTRNVTKAKDEHQNVKIEDPLIKEEANPIKLGDESIKSEETDSEEKYWDSTSFDSESDSEPDGVTLFDIVAGRIGYQGFIEEDEDEDPISVGEYLVARQNEVAPEEATMRPFDAHLDCRHALPDSDLLKALHRHAADFYDKVEDSEDDFQSMDETALLAMGILMEEFAIEVLGETGHLTFLQQSCRDGRGRQSAYRRTERQKIKDELGIKDESDVDIKVEPDVEPAITIVETLPKAEPAVVDVDRVKVEPGLDNADDTRAGLGVNSTNNGPKVESGSSYVDMNDIEEYQQDLQPEAQQETSQTRAPRQDMASQQGYHSDIGSWISQTFQHPQDDPIGHASSSHLPFER